MGGHVYGFEVWGKGGQWGALAVGSEGPIRRMLPKQNNKHNMKPVARYQAANGRHRTRGQSSKNAGGREGREEDKSLGRRSTVWSSGGIMLRFIAWDPPYFLSHSDVHGQMCEKNDQ